jgi:diacylglycerol kinase (ATP)
VVAVGGDGTVNRVINRCDPRRLRLGIIPRGSANDLGAELRIPRDFGGAWEVLEAGCYDEIDLVSVNGCRFATCGGIGLASGVAMRANGWKASPGGSGAAARRLGRLVYVLAALAEIRRHEQSQIDASISDGSTTRRVRLSTALVSNQARVGGLFTASPEASNRDGQLELCGVVAPSSRARLLGLCLELLRGRPGRCPELFELRAGAVTIETEAEVTFFGDGEPLARGRRFRIEVLPRALSVATLRGESFLAEAA